MLTNIPNAINKLMRQTVINHPNAWGGVILRKQVNRASSTTGGGMPTMGGMGVMSSEDEEKISYTHVGNVYAIRAELFSPASMHDRYDINTAPTDEVRMLIEPEPEPSTSNYFQLKTRDILYVPLGTDLQTSPKIAYELVSSESTTDIPPFNIRWVCNRRADIDLN